MGEYNGLVVGSAGYPGRLTNLDQEVAVWDTGPFTWIESTLTFESGTVGVFRVGVDIGGGQSGSPLYVRVGGTWYVVGILYGELTQHPGACEYPGAVALTNTLVETITAIMQGSGPPVPQIEVDFVAMP